MGISDDISRKPKRSSSRPSSHRASEDFVDESNKKSQADESRSEIEDSHKIEIEKTKKTDFFDQITSKHDDFFPPKKDKKITFAAKPEQPKKEPATKKNHLSRLIIRRIVSLTLWLILLTLILNNWSQIIQALSGNKKTSSSDSSVKIIPQDYSTTTAPTTTSQTTETPASTAPATSTAPSTAAPTTTTPPTTATYNKAAVKIEILNGNGIQKAADVAKKLLATAGFTVSKTGNAANFKYTTTNVYYKTGNLSAATDVSKALSSYDPVTTNNDKTCTTYDIVIILGK